MRQKTAAIQKLGAALLRISQDADREFCAEIADDNDSVELAIRVLGVRRFRVDYGITGLRGQFKTQGDGIHPAGSVEPVFCPPSGLEALEGATISGCRG